MNHPGLIEQITQQTIPYTSLRDIRECAFGRLNQTSKPLLRIIQAYREHRGEPAYRAGYVDAFQEAFAAMSFEVDSNVRARPPTGKRPDQRGDQNVIDTGVVSRRYLPDQGAGRRAAQPPGQYCGATRWSPVQVKRYRSGNRFDDP
ncbi:hypothetical protein D3C84_854610 [compost metagenome]